MFSFSFVDLAGTLLNPVNCCSARFVPVKSCRLKCYNNACCSPQKLYYNIMRPIRFILQPLLDLFERLRALTIPEMKAALGTGVDMTVFRKLAALDYLTSYSQ